MRCLYVNIFYILKGIGKFLSKKRCEKLLKDRRQNSRKTTQPTLAQHGTSQPTNVVPTWPKMAPKNQDDDKCTPKKTRVNLKKRGFFETFGVAFFVNCRCQVQGWKQEVCPQQSCCGRHRCEDVGILYV